MLLTGEHLESFSRHSARCNTLLNSLHEGCSPYSTSKERIKWGIEDEYGGITGTIVPKDLQRVASVLISGETEEGNHTVLPEEYRLIAGTSVFCDIGCGTGRPSCYFASLPLRCSMGFDVDSLQVLNSTAGYNRLLQQKVEFTCPVTFFKQDALSLRTLDPVTHAYSFIGYPNFAFAVARLVADTKSVKVLVAVVLRSRELIEAGLMKSPHDEDILLLPGMRMSAGNSYLGYVIPITAERRANLKSAIRKNAAKATQTSEQCEMISPIRFGEQSLAGDLTRALEQGVNVPFVIQSDGHGKRPLRACRRYLVNSDDEENSLDGHRKRNSKLVISPTKRPRLKPSLSRTGMQGPA